MDLPPDLDLPRPDLPADLPPLPPLPAVDILLFGGANINRGDDDDDDDGKKWVSGYDCFEFVVVVVVWLREQFQKRNGECWE